MSVCPCFGGLLYSGDLQEETSLQKCKWDTPWTGLLIHLGSKLIQCRLAVGPGGPKWLALALNQMAIEEPTGYNKDRGNSQVGLPLAGALPCRFCVEVGLLPRKVTSSARFPLECRRPHGTFTKPALLWQWPLHFDSSHPSFLFRKKKRYNTNQRGKEGMWRMLNWTGGRAASTGFLSSQAPQVLQARGCRAPRVGAVFCCCFLGGGICLGKMSSHRSFSPLAGDPIF